MTNPVAQNLRERGKGHALVTAHNFISVFKKAWSRRSSRIILGFIMVTKMAERSAQGLEPVSLNWKYWS